MQSQRINFYLTPYQIARMLATVNRLDPTYTPSTIHQLVKLVALDYCAKLNIGYSDTIPSETWQKLTHIMPATRQKPEKSSDQEILDTMYLISKNIPQAASQLIKETLTQQEILPSKQNKPLPIPSEEIKQTIKSSALTEDQPTESIKTTVDDFAFLKSLSEGDFE